MNAEIHGEHNSKIRQDQYYYFSFASAFSIAQCSINCSCLYLNFCYSVHCRFFPLTFIFKILH